jgi:hypothetical protein
LISFQMLARRLVVPAVVAGRSPVSRLLISSRRAVVPFALTRADREAAHDPRPSIAERYADNAAYVAAVKAAAAQMVDERLLLPMDAERAIEAATQDTLARLR